MLLSMLVYVDTDTVHFINADKLKLNILNYVDALLKEPNKKNIELADQLLNFITYMDNQDNTQED